MEGDLLQEAPTTPTVKPQWPLVVALIAGVLVIALIGILVANETSSLGTSTSRQVAAIRQACGQWVGSEHMGAAAPCSAMADWMGQQVAEGHVADRMMWGDAGAMAGSCVQWADATSSGAVDGISPSVWCDRMSSWMEGHVGNWSSWMMTGGMTGGS